MHNEDTLPADITLTAKQQAFVLAYVANGGDHVRAAQEAGYAAPNEGIRLIQNPSIIKALQPAILDRLSTQAATALGAVEVLMKSSRSDYVKLEAAKTWLDRAGFKPPDRVAVAVAGDLRVSFDIAPQSGLVISGETDQSG